MSLLSVLAFVACVFLFGTGLFFGLIWLGKRFDDWRS